MSDLSSLDLEIRPGTAGALDEERFEIRRASVDEFIGWCRVTDRMSDGDRIVHVDLQFIQRAGLTGEQVAAVQERLVKRCAIALG